MDTERALMALVENPDLRIWKTPFDDLTEPEQVFQIVWELEAEVNNGGFHQYFFNNSGDLAGQAAWALQKIGATRASAIVTRALEVFGPDGVAADESTRRAQIAALSSESKSQWDDIDEAFYAYPDNLSELLHTYVRDHAGDIPGA